MIRKTNASDISFVLNIYQEARFFLQDSSVDQWQRSGPGEESLQKDRENNQSYVFVENERIIGTFALLFTEDPTYDYIENGSWKFTDPYCTIHRFALSKDYRGKGYGRKIMKEIERYVLDQKVKYIRIDTHPDNKNMLGLIKSCQYLYAGDIYVADGTLRQAFEKEL